MMSEFDTLVEKYIVEMTKERQVADWNKIIKVIQSIDNKRQVQTAKNMIDNYVKLHGREASHQMLELELKAISRKLK